MIVSPAIGLSTQICPLTPLVPAQLAEIDEMVEDAGVDDVVTCGTTTGAFTAGPFELEALEPGACDVVLCTPDELAAELEPVAVTAVLLVVVVD